MSVQEIWVPSCTLYFCFVFGAQRIAFISTRMPISALRGPEQSGEGGNKTRPTDLKLLWHRAPPGPYTGLRNSNTETWVRRVRAPCPSCLSGSTSDPMGEKMPLVSGWHWRGSMCKSNYKERNQLRTLLSVWPFSRRNQQGSWELAGLSHPESCIFFKKYQAVLKTTKTSTGLFVQMSCESGL